MRGRGGPTYSFGYSRVHTRKNHRHPYSRTCQTFELFHVSTPKNRPGFEIRLNPRGIVQFNPIPAPLTFVCWSFHIGT